jgi:hypothetical protein
MIIFNYFLSSYLFQNDFFYFYSSVYLKKKKQDEKYVLIVERTKIFSGIPTEFNPMCLREFLLSSSII